MQFSEADHHSWTLDQLYALQFVKGTLRGCLNFGYIGDEVHVLGRDHWFPEPELGPAVKDRKQHEREIVCSGGSEPMSLILVRGNSREDVRFPVSL